MGTLFDRKYRIRLPRNAVFVIERTSIQDSLIDLALKPFDIVNNTSLGQAVHREISPLLTAVEELSMPAVLTGKLAVKAATTGVHAGVIGLGTAMNVMMNNTKDDMNSGNKVSGVI